MSTVLVTGATGFVGKQLALKLAGSGQTVHAMYRSEAKIGGLEHKNIRLFKGTLTDLASIDNAMIMYITWLHLQLYGQGDRRRFMSKMFRELLTSWNQH